VTNLLQSADQSTDRGNHHSFPESPSRAPTISATMLSRRLARSFASIASNSPPPSFNTTGPYQVFDRNAKTIQRNRAALRNNGERSRTVDYVREEVAERMMERFLVRLLCSLALPVVEYLLRISRDNFLPLSTLVLVRDTSPSCWNRKKSKNPL